MNDNNKDCINGLILECKGELTFFDNKLIGVYLTINNLEDLCEKYAEFKIKELMSNY